MTGPKILLLEDLNATAIEPFKERYSAENVTSLKNPMDKKELLAAIKDVDVLGIRSRTKVDADVIKAAQNLCCIGCYGIGTNQVDLKAAKMAGIPVFNAPYANTRSVAELGMGNVIMLMRRVFEKSTGAHQGKWLKASSGCYEVRGKTLGIIGYGHIGSQLAVMAESLGMRVMFYDPMNRLVIGNAIRCRFIDEIYEGSDIISIHVPLTDRTRHMIGEAELAKMKKGAFFMNLSRGELVDVDALVKALDSGHIAGAAIDVFAKEPNSADEKFVSPLQGQPNVILTPHIGGSTVEAQRNIGSEVSGKLIRCHDEGVTLSAVNFVELDYAKPKDALANVQYLVHIHKNVPGVLSQINEVFAEVSANVVAQHLGTDADIGYTLIGVEKLKNVDKAVQALDAIKGTIKVRALA